MYGSFDLADFELRESTESKTYKVGTIWENNQGEQFTIIAHAATCYVEKKTGWKKYPNVIIEFSNGFKREIQTRRIRSKEVKNPFYPIVYGVGFMGNGDYKAVINKKRTKEYEAWTGMLARCYSEEYKKSCPTYKDCTVDPRWHNFQNFCEDIQHLEGYAEWKASKKSREYALDKDTLIEGNKTYSKDTCKFLLFSINSGVCHLTGKTYIAYNEKEDLTEEFTSMTVFAKEHNMSTTGVCDCINGKYKQNKGWTFRVKE